LPAKTARMCQEKEKRRQAECDWGEPVQSGCSCW